MISLLVILCALVIVATCSLCPTTINSTNSCVDNNGNNPGCKNVKTIYRPVSQIFCDQPIYYFFLANNEKYTTLDNACLTFFALEDSPETFKCYSSYVFVDGTQLIETYVTRTNPSGGNVWSNHRRTYTNFNIGYIGCGAFIRYACPSYGDNFAPFFLGFGPGEGPVGNGTGRIADSCLAKARELAADNDLGLGDLYVLPYRLPTRCIFQQKCLPKKSPLYPLQAGFCKPYNATCSQTCFKTST